MAGGEIVKRSHFVPESYLLRFADERKQVYVFDKVSGKSFPANVRNIGSQKAYYDLPDWARGQDDDPQVAEKFFGQFESHWKLAINSLINRAEKGQREPIRDTDKPRFAHLLLMQALRTPAQREVTAQIIKGTNSVVSAVAKKWGTDQPKGYPMRATEEALRVGHVDAIFDPLPMLRSSLVLHQHIWVLQKAVGNKPLYTSDHPVAMRGHLGFVGISEPGIEIAFPLNPKYVLVLLERTHHHYARPFENQLVEISDEIVTYYNFNQTATCFRQVYSHADDFSDAKSMCEMFPHIQDVHMPRAEVRSPELE